MVIESSEGYGGKILTDILINKAKFVEILFVFEDSEILVESLDLVKVPGVKKE